ncbi:NCS2 family permease [Kribbella sp. NPDC056951]|uniref:NCS2 family permease n=1 Tax=Kribbella sp. NPDC056951 TaxID=3345978 RepID=UPI0036352DC1
MSSSQATTARSGSNPFDSFFKISERGSTLGRELRGGLVTFFTMAYIVVLNPLILGSAKDGTPLVEGGPQLIGGGLDSGAAIAKVAVATALVAGVVTIVMGLVANFPLALASGLGLNAFIAFSVASQMTWADAMGLVVLEGLIILVLVFTGFRKAVFEAVPVQLKVAISVGIGLFIAFIGVVDAGFVRPGVGGVPPVQLGVGGNLKGWPVLVFVVGLILIITLYARKVKGAILIGIISATVLAIVVEAIVKVGGRTTDNPGGWGLSVPKLPDQVFTKPNFDLVGEFNLFGSFERVGLISALLLIFTLMLADFFDTMGTMTAIGAEAGLLDKDGNPPNSQRILIVDSVAAAAGGAASVSSNTSYIESASGVGEGARTGLASVVTGICFLISMVVAPLVTLVPYEAATPALILVGFLMMTQVKGIDFDDIELAFPAFLTIILMPFTYSITAGIGAGFVSFVILKVVRGKARQVHPLMWVVSALFVIYFAIGPLSDWLT